MQLSAYRAVWAHPVVRQAAILGFLGKAPWFGAAIILTLHVVDGLGRSYAAAGLVTAVFTLATAVSSPWRGRLLDTVGLRRTLIPSLVVLPVAFLAATFVGYGWLLVAMAAVGLFAVPWFVITRQMTLAAVPVEQRRTALALDSVLTELAFMFGPLAGVLAATTWDTGWALVTFALLSLLGALGFVVVNPPLVAPVRPDAAADATPRAGMRTWLNRAVATTFVANVAIAFTLAGSDLAIVGAMRAMGTTHLLGVVLAVWASGSLIGGLIYGGLTGRTIPLTFLVAGLALTTLLGSLGVTWWLLSLAMMGAGLFCATSLAAAVERISHHVPERYRGEALGWQGTFATAGNALAPPVVGWVIDHQGWQAGFLATGGVGLLLAALGWLVLVAGVRTRRRIHATQRGRPSSLSA
ncbi:MFS transporter [Propioniciclava soli]|uniref:MFS transporter n=1 Tax=Propioniciclava soli TaxID=2775081 RepID=UPI001E361E70